MSISEALDESFPPVLLEPALDLLILWDAKSII